MNNSRRLNINKDKDEINKDYFVFTLDLKNDKGLVYVGTCQDYFGSQQGGFRGEYKADVIIGLREKEVINVLTQKIDPMQAILERSISVQGNVLLVLKLVNKFLRKYYDF